MTRQEGKDKEEGTMDNSTAKYLFESVIGSDLESIADDAMSAYLDINKRDYPKEYLKLKKYSRSNSLPPDGYSLLDIGYGLSLAYKRVVA